MDSRRFTGFVSRVAAEVLISPCFCMFFRLPNCDAKSAAELPEHDAAAAEPDTRQCGASAARHDGPVSVSAILPGERCVQ